MLLSADINHCVGNKISGFIDTSHSITKAPPKGSFTAIPTFHHVYTALNPPLPAINLGAVIFTIQSTSHGAQSGLSVPPGVYPPLGAAANAAIHITAITHTADNAFLHKNFPIQVTIFICVFFILLLLLLF
jgi:hypothetical protein